MFVRVLSFLDKENVIYKQRFGFRPKHSTTHAIISITEKIREALDKGKFACGVFVDLPKAFDQFGIIPVWNSGKHLSVV